MRYMYIVHSTVNPEYVYFVKHFYFPKAEVNKIPGSGVIGCKKSVRACDLFSFFLVSFLRAFNEFTTIVQPLHRVHVNSP